MAISSSKIVSINDVLKEELVIGNYQRPYVWDDKNIRQLLNDVVECMNDNKSCYRIGSIILYKNDKDKQSKCEIVDGQQRITSILLILSKLKEELKGEIKNDCFSLLNKLKYNHVYSFEHIIKNYETIGLWLNQYLPKEDFKRFFIYLVSHCEFVEIVVDSYSEAFQLFESQNGTGKDLESYNLLKAYHIRAMELDSIESKILCDRRWEAATQFKLDSFDDKTKDLLKILFDEVLYKSRKWCRGEIATDFSKKRIYEFKGFTLDKNHTVLFPFQNRQLLLYITDKLFNSLFSGIVDVKNRFLTNEPNSLNPFTSINQEIVNGRLFFEYVETYVTLYKEIFENSNGYRMKSFKEFFKKNCLYSKCYRRGDTYLRWLYVSLIMVLFDRFGENELDKYYKTLYKWVYKLRLEKTKIYKETVFKYPNEGKNPFSVLCKSKSSSDLFKLNSLNLIPKSSEQIRLQDVLKDEFIRFDDDDVEDKRIKSFLISGELHENKRC